LVIWRKGCIAVALAALWLAPAAAATDATAIYSDFAADGKLSCSYSRTDLETTLHDAKLNEYGDPYTIAGLKVAIRRQLAGGCGHLSSGSGDSGSHSILIGVGAVVLLGAGGWFAKRSLGNRR
jgi:hypothetical protein